MALMSLNVKSLRRNFGDISQLTNWISDSGALYHMAPKISDLLPGSLAEQIHTLKFKMGISSQ